MKIAITGASGLIGTALLRTLSRGGHSLRALVRSDSTVLPPGVERAMWNPRGGQSSDSAIAGADAIINLAGENVAQRWTPRAKRDILESRVEGTRALVQAISRLHRPPATLISASAIGYYGSRGDEPLTESSAPAAGFLAEVCAAWEREATLAESYGVRVVRMRIGVALDPHGGALVRMLPPFRLGLGGPLAGGLQWMSWIHLADLADLFRFALEDPIAGAVNAVAPGPLTNLDFTRELARALHRPAIFPVPAFALRALFGEMSEVLLASQRVVPAAAETAGFQFRFPNLASALADLLA